MVGGGGGDGDVEVLGELGEFRDYGLFVAGIAVDGDDVGEGKVLTSGGFKFVLEDGRGEVLAGSGAVDAVVGEGDFDEEVLGRGRIREEGEKAAAGVAGEGGGGVAFSDDVAGGGGSVGHGEGENIEVADVEGVVGGYGVELVFRSVGGGSEGEVGVEKSVHEMGGDGIEGVGEAEQVYGCAVVHGLEAEAGEVPDVVEVSMGEEDGLESVLFAVGEAGHETASVDG